MKKLKDSDYDIIFSYLEELFPNADTELHFNTPFQLLVAVILSAQTTDKQVNKVTDKLFQTIKEPQDILNMGLKTALQTSKLLEERIPSQYKLIAHHCIILFGRYQCMARSPKCENCHLQSLCLYFTKNYQKKCLK